VHPPPPTGASLTPCCRGQAEYWLWLWLWQLAKSQPSLTGLQSPTPVIYKPDRCDRPSFEPLTLLERQCEIR